jgi:N-acetylglucosaminyldiphosphoundecaprenol N-acetyl-beta-D-mannosaminyltransferase
MTGTVPPHTCRGSVRGALVNGVRIDAVTNTTLLAQVDSFITCGRSHVVHFLAAHPTVEARSDPSYRSLLNEGDLNVADGMPVAIAARLQGSRGERLPGTDALHVVARWGLGKGVNHFLYGATDDTLERMRTNLERLYPGISIAGQEAPPFRVVTDEEVDATVATIRDAGADVVWVGLGAPKQDLMGARLREREAAPVIMCVGAAFDFVGGVKRRAPEWMQRFGLEWLFRLISEPRRLWRRYLVGNTRFIVGVAVDLLRRRPVT